MEDISSKFTIAVIGRSGSGKGVQAHALLSLLGKRAYHMETGRFLREITREHENPTIRIARRLMGQGRLFPSWFSSYTWLNKFIAGGKADRHLIFDGAPRRLSEARLLDEVLVWHGRKKALCIYLDVIEKTAVDRLLARKRKDDTLRAIQNRMAYFSRDVLPVIEYFKKERRLLRINGELSTELVFRQIESLLSKRLGRNWERRT
ncbi:MAG: hypothetical protein A2847_01155 [Candidatus Sungbacteria bacterium RIFCSPHIGHO2_01_FULL_50_25]|uniref:Adenylate kinase n=1 Tax=Candidatus Sungbacteria bacterium RIFCSPHIGHO2_01_FULL_50_25 TaxID=1802265 RepID=A0A1G2KAR2_9BACT|nr:MAG: hypothetical protein A2847_01155 [Candidatus Sungbacteria bacterium RIFCSPHIGHO2_01_FULL_50_25]